MQKFDYKNWCGKAQMVETTKKFNYKSLIRKASMVQ